MEIYLAIITTVLVITQVIRVTQNAVSLHRQRQEVLKHLEWFDRQNVTESDFEIQKQVFKLLLEKLEEEQERREAGTV